MASEEYAIVVLPGGVHRVWPTRGRYGESFEEHCATCGASVIRGYPSLEEAIAALCLPMELSALHA